MKKISVVLACYNEEKYIAKAIDTLLAMNYPHHMIEILIIDGGSTDNTLKIISGYSNCHKNIKTFNNPKKISPVAFNIGISNSTGDYVILMSAHSNYKPDYFKILTEKIIEFDADLIGGYAETKTISNTKKSNAIIKVMMNKFGLGGAKVRTGINKPTQVDTATGMYKKSIFDKVGLFNENLIRNQDMEMSRRITANGGKIFIIPDAPFTYFARDNYKDLWKNNFNNGMWIPLTVYITKRFNSLSIRHYIPMIFILSIVIPIFLSYFNIYFIGISLFSLLIHFLLILTVSIKLNNDSTSILNLIKAFYTIHLSYGIGSLIGLFKINYLLKK